MKGGEAVGAVSFLSFIHISATLRRRAKPYKRVNIVDIQSVSNV